jgi:TRAP-type transport system periplasmic protein
VKKRSIILVISLLLSVVLSACGQSASGGSEKEYKLKMSVTVGDSSTWYEAAEKLANDLKKETDGRITMEIYPNEQLSGGDSGKGVEMLVKGSTDLSFHSTIIYSILDERLGVASAPFLFKDLNEVDAAFGGDAGEAVKEILREKGVETLGFGQNGFRQLTNSKLEVKNPDDIKGLKIRIPGITMYTDLWKQLETNPTAMTFSEVFTSLQQGTIDGQENPIDVIHSAKLNEVQDYITMWNYSYDPLVLGINKKTFDSMSKEDQELLKKLGAEAAEYQIKLAREKETEQIEDLESKGMKFYYPTDDDLAKFKEKVQPVYDKYESVWGEDLLKKFLSE